MRTSEAISKAMRATPPEIRGVFLGRRLRALVGWEHDGRNRLFWLDGMSQPVEFKDLVRNPQNVALAETERTPKLFIQWSTKFVSCPVCRRSLGVPGPFWIHYNQEHAQVPFWLNEEDWREIVGSKWISPFASWK